MLDSLKFVQGAIKKTTLTQELEHYAIKDGRITGYNGHLALSSPIDLDLNVYPKAAIFSKAIQACSDEAALSVTKAGRLSIRSGKFRVFVECMEELTFLAKPEGDRYDVPDNLLSDLEILHPFIAEDASRPWAMGILIQDGCYYVTNNILCVQKWVGHDLPAINIPRFAVQELLRVKETPLHLYTDLNSITFVYKNDRWLRTQMYDTSWPIERVKALLEGSSEPVPLPDGLEDALNLLYPFLPEKASPVFFEDGGIASSREAEEGVHLEFAGLPSGPIFNIHQLQLICRVAETVDWSLYPKPCLFFGDRLRGAVAGMRV